MIDTTKKYRTMDGEVEFYKVVGEYIHGRIEGRDCAYTWRKVDGTCVENTILRLIPAKREFFLNGYSYKDEVTETIAYKTKDEAIEASKKCESEGYTILFRAVKVTEGEGLDDE
jgi:hypothetical protein